ncbi:MAG: hypothetical protein JNK24_07985 [Alphaproteobacteria bacterium]|nr:hypothetical protein [Alphaproteobacteria bacterium]
MSDIIGALQENKIDCTTNPFVSADARRDFEAFMAAAGSVAPGKIRAIRDISVHPSCR